MGLNYIGDFLSYLYYWSDILQKLYTSETKYKTTPFDSSIYVGLMWFNVLSGIYQLKIYNRYIET